MIKLTAIKLRKLWIDFFKSKQHLEIPSHSLIPQKDKSLLWINSGVAGLKPYFTGQALPPSKRMVNSQKSLRTNDVENVGVTSRHHTFFEMLGNFSIGDYFKDEIIEWGYEFLTKVLKIDPKLLYITYFNEDDFTFKKWQEVGIAKDHLLAKGRSENFWDLGQGPCGPCTEIYYDRGPKYDPKSQGLKMLMHDAENDRYIEIWNIVFSQFNNDGKGNYTELVQKNIDTGAGLERIACISQGGHTNFDTDLFLTIINKIEQFTRRRYDDENYFKKNKKISKTNTSFRVIADHVRSSCMAIADGATPGSSGRSYIIRMLIRRALKKGIGLGIKKPFLHKLCGVVQKTLPYYPFDVKAISTIIHQEEKRFIKTIFEGQEIFEKAVKGKKELSGKVAFKLLDTYGYPIEMTQELALESGIKINMDEFDSALQNHKEISKTKNKHQSMQKQISSLQRITCKISDFIGYDKLSCQTKIVKLMNDQGDIDVSNDDLSYVVFAKTPFYATAGGQKFDKGVIQQSDNKFTIKNVFKDKYLNNIHVIDQPGLIIDKPVKLVVDKAKRIGAMRNHSATHITFSALEKVLGHKFKQSGSSLDHTKLHLDFDHFEKPSTRELRAIEKQVKIWIKENHPSEVFFLKRSEIKSSGVTTLENEDYSRYGDHVRSVRIGDFSYELCGGTHVPSTNVIEDFIITNVESKKAGVYRLTAITGRDNVNKYRAEQTRKLEQELLIIINKNREFKAKYKINYDQEIDSIKNALQSALADYKILRKEHKKQQNYNINDVKVINNFAIYWNFQAPAKAKEALFKMMNLYPDQTSILVIAQNQERMRILVGSNHGKARKAFDIIAAKFNGRGGGSPKMVQGAVNFINSSNDLEKVLNEA